MKKYIITFLSIFLFNLQAVEAKEKNVNIYLSSREIPQKVFYNSNGHKLTLDDFHGKFVLLLYWSRDCVPCIKELKSLNGFYNKTYGSSIELILISNGKEWKNIEEKRKFMKIYKAGDMNFYIDPEGKIAESFGIFAFPHTVLINTKGREIGRIRGAADWDEPEILEYIHNLKSKYNNL